MFKSEIQLRFAVSDAYCNKEPVSDEKNSWHNQTGTFDDLAAALRMGLAVTGELALNITNSPSYSGPADPSLGPWMRDQSKRSERVNLNVEGTNLFIFDSDGDTTIEAVDAGAEDADIHAFTTSSSHERKNNGEHRLRLFFTTPERVEPTFNDPTHTDPHWKFKCVRLHIINTRLKILGITQLIDRAGMDPARIWYGNTGVGQKIGGKMGDVEAGPLVERFYGHVLPTGFVDEAIALHEPEFIRTEQQQQQSQDSEEFAIGTPKQLSIAAWIFSNNILSNDRAENYSEWIRFVHAIKKLDPQLDVLLEPFLKFSEQSQYHEACEEDIRSTMDRLPDADEIFIGITAIKDAAREDTPGWEASCPHVHGGGITDVGSRGCITSSICGQSFRHLQRMYERAGQHVPTFEELQLRTLDLTKRDKPPAKKVSPKRNHRGRNLSALLGRKSIAKAQTPVPIAAGMPTPLKDFNGYDIVMPSRLSNPNDDF